MYITCHPQLGWVWSPDASLATKFATKECAEACAPHLNYGSSRGLRHIDDRKWEAREHVFLDSVVVGGQILPEAHSGKANSTQPTNELDIPDSLVGPCGVSIRDILKHAGFDDPMRLVERGAVKLDNEKITDPQFRTPRYTLYGQVLQVGDFRPVKLVPKA